MIFNSISFLIFFAIVFILYWFVSEKNLKLQNLLLLAASYAFYYWADSYFLILLIGSSAFNYLLGIYINKTASGKKKRLLFYLGIVQALGTLLYFKYFNFFIASIIGAFSSINISLNIHTLQIMLPLGLSFYTFRTLSYIIDIYRGKIEPANDWVVFFCYVAFFPCISSGPIDRAGLLIPQLEKKRTFTYETGVDGARQILWGLFKKVIIANSCTAASDVIFQNYSILPGSALLLGAFFFTIGLYADFSGYSDMAIGLGRLLGFRLTKNFNYPFFAQNVADYWRRWHMSLTSWVTDYVFTPLSIAFRDLGKPGLIAAIILNMVVVGLWHGARWTFVLYGCIMGLYFIPLILTGNMGKKKIVEEDKLLPSFAQLRNMLATFTLVVVTNVIFRANSVADAIHYYSGLFSASLFSFPGKNVDLRLLVLAIAFLCIEWVQRNKDHVLQIQRIASPGLRWGIYIMITLAIVDYWTSSGHKSGFIYVKF